MSEEQVGRETNELETLRSTHTKNSDDDINEGSDLESISSTTAVNNRDFSNEQDESLGVDDPVIADYMAACQKGDLKTIRELIESSTVSVDDHDTENVTGLHWASINNRLSVVKYLVSKGADPNSRGGVLNATPLHWACRYGLVYIADFLIRECKANPSLKDSQGFNCLHLATHSSNVMAIIYLLNFTDIPVDSTDPSSRTALHWAAYQGDSLSCDVLLKNGADVTKIDEAGFTPLHWSLIRGVKSIMINLIEAGGDINLRNNEGKNCFDIAIDMNCSDKLYMALKEAGYNKAGNKINYKLSSKTAKIITFLLPYASFPLAFKILTFSKGFGIPKAIIAFLILFLQHFAMLKLIVPIYNNHSNPLLRTPYFSGLFSGTSFWVIIVWFVFVLPTTFENHIFMNVLFLIGATLSLSTFFKSMFINPGYIPIPSKREDIQSSIINLLYLKKYDSNNFCIKTFIRKPLRSRYSSFGKALVAKFDHYCPWIYNDVGVRNHKLFITFILSLEVSIIAFLSLVNSHFDKIPNQKVFDNFGNETEYTCSILSDSLCKGFQQESFIFNLSVFCVIQCIWLTLLNIGQIFQICTGLTTWEAKNMHTADRDPHGNVVNPFYSSVPSEYLHDEDSTGEDDIITSGGTTSGPGAQHSQQSPTNGTNAANNNHNHNHNHNHRHLNIASCCSTILAPQNLLDFWFIKDEDESYNLRTLIKLPIRGEGNLNGRLIDYYKLYEFPPRNPEQIV
ncbi:hypothetical protein PACTADRAFT_85305 [Pachysolen tannophilus NRRL Y-2460]|uniref:Palmitoyltransferase n=1 Tax=Pachysolen tannophilus NRRL Y-2460 TaxID=669874 RepID=A0A1E4TU09_PACTA|nr:hypothetical protein PACTADRAFT_85305 [Pachysolen tannophilus NRRL Y-2460]